MLSKLSFACFLGLVATAFGQSCCPNGIYIDDPELICNNPAVFAYGEGQCYGQFQINCYTFPNSRDSFVFDYTLPHDSSIADCYGFCHEFAPSFTDVIFIPFATGPPNCECAIDQVGLNGDLGAHTLTYCGLGPPAPSPPCCERFTGDESKICVDPTDAVNYGDGKCLANNFEVSSFQWSRS
jgi:hypothetical protein